MEIIIGKQGNQPFAIDGARVSRKHCKLTIEDGTWILTDLNSSNGTFVRNEKTGMYEPVTTKKIDPFTYICLAEDTSQGCTFYADSVVNPNSYAEAFDYMKDIVARFDAKAQAMRERHVIQAISVFGLNLVVAGVSLISSIDPEVRMWMLRTVPVASSGFSIINSLSSKADLNKQRQLFMNGPNPACHHVLNVRDVYNGVCPKCKASAYNKDKNK